MCVCVLINENVCGEKCTLPFKYPLHKSGNVASCKSWALVPVRFGLVS